MRIEHKKPVQRSAVGTAELLLYSYNKLHQQGKSVYFICVCLGWGVGGG